jgi:hypothetical protein
MTFSSENDYRQWLRINGYKQDIIDIMAYKWDSVSVVNGEIIDSNSAPAASIYNTEVTPSTDEVSTDEN